jgi:hypothetical protein
MHDLVTMVPGTTLKFYTDMDIGLLHPLRSLVLFMQAVNSWCSYWAHVTDSHRAAETA